MVKPTVWIVDDNKLEILLLFTDIPMNVLQGFEKKCLARLAHLQKQKDEFLKQGNEGDGDDDDQSLDDDDEGEAGSISDFDADEARDEVNAFPLSSPAALGSAAGAQVHGNSTVLLNNATSSNKSGSGEGAMARSAERLATRRKAVIARSDGFSSKHRNLLKLVLLLVASIIYFVSTYFVEIGNILSFLEARPSEVNASQRRQSDLLRAVFQLNRLCTQNYTSVHWSPSPGTDLFTSLADADLAISQLATVEFALAYGSALMNVNAPQPSDTQESLMFSSACNAPESTDDCGTFANELIGHGLHGTFLETVEQMRSASSLIANALQANASSFAIINTTFHGEEMEMIRHLQERYLKAPNTFSSALYLQSTQLYLEATFSSRLAALFAFVACTLLLYQFSFAPLVQDLHAEQRRTTDLLLLIPAQTMETMHSVRSFVDKLASISESSV